MTPERFFSIILYGALVVLALLVVLWLARQLGLT